MKTHTQLTMFEILNQNKKSIFMYKTFERNQKNINSILKKNKNSPNSMQYPRKDRKMINGSLKKINMKSTKK